MKSGHLKSCVAAAPRRLIGALAVSIAVASAGCAGARTNLVDCPLSIEQQQQAVLEVVPKGSSRDEAERRLKAAGIEFNSSGKGSIYYLVLWNRHDGKRWHIDVALLFDQAGKLYQTRAANAETGLLSEFERPAGPAAARRPPTGAFGDSTAETGPAVTADDDPPRDAFPGRSWPPP